MRGYLQSSFDPDAGSQTSPTRQKGSWKIIPWSIAYMIPLFALWFKTGFPDSFGVYITASGKGGLIERYYYSYLLLQRHEVLDVITFLYMWSVVIGFIAWIASKRLRNVSFSIYSAPKRTSAQNVVVDPSKHRLTLPSFALPKWASKSLVFILIFGELIWVFGINRSSLSELFNSAPSIRERCFNGEGSQSDVNSACRQLIKDSTTAIRKEPHEERGYFNRGFAFEHFGDLPQAIADFSEVIRLSPNASQAYFFRWAAYKDLGDNQRANSDFAALQRLDPKLAAEVGNNH